MKAFITALMLIFSLNAYAISDTKCMAAAIWAESRGEPLIGQIAVGHVVFNRMMVNDKTACQVVKEKGQFSWTKDSAERARAFAKSVNFIPLATLILNGDIEDPTKGATYFHLASIRPRWTKGLEKTKRIKNHIFWRDSGEA